ncbi:MAG: hypothetical protein KC561_14530, partial [Myxococcales bacterium]|nr:hypothetical protein [Myxococcales bacterium]
MSQMPPQGPAPQQYGGPPPQQQFQQGPPQGGPPMQQPQGPPPASAESDFGTYAKNAWGVVSQDFLTWFLVSIVGWFAVGCGFYGGYQHCYLKAKRGQKVEVTDVLYPFKSGRFVDLFLGAITSGFGGIFTAAIWGYTVPLQIDQGMEWQPARAKAAQQQSGQYVGYLILNLVSGFM